MTNASLDTSTGELPSGWEKAELDDVLSDIQVGFASGKHNKTGSGVPHLRPMNISRTGQLVFDEVKSVQDESDRRLRRGDVLFNNTNSPVLIGKTAFVDVDQELAFSNHMTRLRVHKSVLDPKFLATQLHGMWMNRYFESICSNHVNQASVSGKRLKTVEVVVPLLPEQERIVEVLEAQLARLDAALEHVQTLRAKAAQFRRSLLRAAFTGALTGHDTSTGELPEGWREIALGELVALKSGFAYKSKDWQQSGVPVIKIANVRNGKVNLSGCSFVSAEIATETAQFAVVKGDLLMTLTGEIGATGIYAEEGPARLNQRVARLDLRPNAEVSDRFLARLLESPTVRDPLWGLAQGMAQPNISPKRVAELSVVLPAPEDQERIVEVLELQFSRLDAALAVADEVEERAAALRRSLLHAAFTGKLTEKWREKLHA